jgi:hypothetical protein
MYGESAYNLVSAFIKSNKHTKKMLAEKIIKTSPNSYYAYSVAVGFGRIKMLLIY